ncbi:hypothetical protein MMC18_009315 [Xylographa bjoerkii]|nr:hypothetical protein [Xylographa bjoerkii]
MDLLEDTYSDMNMDEDFWALPYFTDVPVSFFGSWLPDLEEHDYHRSPLEIPSPQESNAIDGQEQVQTAIVDFDIDVNASMGDPESRSIMQDMNNPNWLDNFLAALDNEATQHSVRSLSSYYSRRGTRHTRLSSAQRHRTPTEPDLEPNIRQTASAISRTLRVSKGCLSGIGRQFDEQPTRESAGLQHGSSRLSVDIEPVEVPSLSTNGRISNLFDRLKHYEAQIGEMEDGREGILEEKSSAAQPSVAGLLETRDLATVETLSPSIDEWLAEIPTRSALHAVQAQESFSPSLSPTDSSISDFLPFDPQDHIFSDPNPVADSGLHHLATPGRAYEEARSAAGSADSGGSHDSMISSASFASHSSWRGRKGRLTTARRNNVQKKARGMADRPYWCTWCRLRFRKRCDWKRHEESQHAPQTEWICMPDGLEILINGRNSCAFCGQADPDVYH